MTYPSSADIAPPCAGQRPPGALSFWLAVGCVFTNFTFGYFAGFPVTGSFLALCAATASVILTTGRMKRAPLVAAALLIALLGLKAIPSLNLSESLQSSSQIAFAAVCLAVLNVKGGHLINREKFALVFGGLMSIHAALIVAQFVMLNVFNSFILQNPLGGFSALGPIGELGSLPGPYLPYIGTLMRPNGFFSEPSVAAAYSVFALACVMATRDIRGVLRLLLMLMLSAGAFFTFALTGWIMLVGIVCAYSMLTLRNMNAGSRSVLISLFVIGVWAALILGGAYLQDRLEGAGSSGSSTYIRFVGPFYLIFDALNASVFGLPVNDPTFLQTRTYLVDFAGRKFHNIDNFYFWLVVYFGLPGIIFISWWLSFVFRSLRSKREMALPLLSLAFFAAATGSGYVSVFILPLAVALAILNSPTPNALSSARQKRSAYSIGSSLLNRNIT